MNKKKESESRSPVMEKSIDTSLRGRTYFQGASVGSERHPIPSRTPTGLSSENADQGNMVHGTFAEP
jgi:hypothetical protein